MKVLKVLRARPELFFRLCGVRLADFGNFGWATLSCLAHR